MSKISNIDSIPLLDEIAHENDLLKAAKTPEERAEIQTRMLGLIGIAQKQAHLDRRDMRDMLKKMGVCLDDILEQARMTNGNVKSLKKWREGMSTEMLQMADNQREISGHLTQVADDLKRFKLRHGPDTEEGKTVEALVLLRRHWKGWTVGLGCLMGIAVILFKYKILIWNIGP